MVGSVIDDAELTRRHPVDGCRGVYHIPTVAHGFQAGCKELRRVAYLQRDVRWRQLTIDAMEGTNGEMLLIGGLWIIAVRDVDDVLLDVLLDDKPRSATQSKTLALSDSMVPMALMVADDAPCLQLDNVARQLA